MTEDREKLVAPCGLDCGVCWLYLSRDSAEIWESVIAKGIPKEVLPCDGCRSTGGGCPVIQGECATRECAKEKGISSCAECGEFPCMKLAPVADKADSMPHNTKVFNLCVVQNQGVKELVRMSGNLKQAYYKGKLVLGEGPRLEGQD
ncbi:DUF3795 domain-containing protein [Elusimicrobiota bacterium]